LNVPDSVGVPLRISWFVSGKKVAITPAGRLKGTPIPVAPVVVRVIFVSIVPIHRVGLLEAVPGALMLTVMLPVAFNILPQPPVKGML
jgi:hypothetical protein